MKLLRGFTFFGGLVILILAFGFIFRIPLALAIWPWEDGRYSYMFVGSILTAISAAALWIGWTGEFGALPAGALNIFVIALTTSIYFFSTCFTRPRKHDRVRLNIVAVCRHQFDRIFLEFTDPAHG